MSCVPGETPTCHRLDPPAPPQPHPFWEHGRGPTSQEVRHLCSHHHLASCAAVLSRHDAEASSFFLFLLFFLLLVFIFIFFKKIRGNAQLVSALVQYNNTNVRLPEYFFLLEARLGKS